MFASSAIGGANAPRARAPSDLIYRLGRTTVLEGAHPHWDYLSFDSARGYLFIARREAGVTVFDVMRRRIVRSLARSEGANMAALVPEFGRGYTANEDGSTTIFDLATLKTLERIKVGEGADSAFYEDATRQVVFTLGDERRLAFLDAKTGRPAGQVVMSSRKLEAVATDGKGALFVAERDRNAVAKVDARSHTLVAEWPVTGCESPTGMGIDRGSRRVFVGCRGERPILAVMDADTGRVTAALPIGRGNDAVIYDPDLRKLFTANGLDGNLIVYDQVDADTYRLAQALTTRPMARTLAINLRTKTLYSVTAEGMVDPKRPVNQGPGPFYPNVYFDGSFTVLEFARRQAPAATAADDE